MFKVWEFYRLVKKMRIEIVRFVYEKIDGFIRYIEGILMNFFVGVIVRGKRIMKFSYKIFVYFDV